LLYTGNVSVVVAHDAGAKVFTTPIDLSKAGAKVGDQGVLQTIFIDGGVNFTYQCADIKIVDSKQTAKSTASSFIGVSEIAYLIIGLTSFVIANL
jgi:hypothetical protein